MLVEQLPILELALQDFRDKNVIAILDLSTYDVIPTSGQYSLAITPPGYETINVPFTPLNMNVYKCVDLGITCSDTGCTPLPDGIYDVKYSVSVTNNLTTELPGITSIERKFIKIDQIKCAYQHAFLKFKLQCDCHCDKKPYLDELRRAKLYIDGSVAACNDSDYKLSTEFYSKAERLLNNLACALNKNCRC